MARIGWIWAGVVAAIGLPAAAQTLGPADAQRYVNPEGVEIIHNRGARRSGDLDPGPANKAAASIAPGAPAGQDASRAAGGGTVQAITSRAAVPIRSRVPAADAAAAQTRTVTQERLDILSAELVNEAQELDTKTKLLRTPRGTNELLDQMYGRLQREVKGHQENIQALHREMERVAGKRR